MLHDVIPTTTVSLATVVTGPSITAVLDVDVWGQSGPASFKLYYATATEVGELVNCVLKYTQYGSAVTNANITLAIDIALKV